MDDNDLPERDVGASIARTDFVGAYLPTPLTTPEQEAEYDAYLAMVARWTAAGLCMGCGSSAQLWAGYCGRCWEPTEVMRD